MIKVKPAYSFDDLLLVPKRSNIGSRSEIDVSTFLGKDITLNLPIVSANMSHVTDIKMAKSMIDMGGLAVLHRFDTPENRLAMFYAATSTSPDQEPGEFGQTCLRHVGFSIGVNHQEKNILKQIQHVKIICIDVAHGDHTKVLHMIDFIRSNMREDILLIAGNVATGYAARDLVKAGADCVKVGVGSGSVCSTRIETGNGVPSLSALSDCYDSIGDKATIIADGGLQNAGSIVKALCFSHAVMLGSLLASTLEAPGNVIEFNGKKYKQYAGSSTHKSKHIEGVGGLVPFRGSVNSVVEKLIQGLTSGCSYQGASNLRELRRNPEFVLVTNAGWIESNPHSIIL